MLFATTTGADGRYEFQPLPAGKYNLTVDSIGPFQADDADIKVSRGACWDLTLSRSPHAQLGGRVQRSDGSPMSQVDVLIMSEDESWFTTEKVRCTRILSHQLVTTRKVCGRN